MATALSSSNRLKLQRTLSQWRHWRPPPLRRPDVVATLSGGRSNNSIRVSDGAQDWVVRLDGIAAPALGLNRNAEWHAQTAAAAAGLAAAPVYRNPDLGALVCEYLPPAAHQATARIEDIAVLLRGIHALAPVKYRLHAPDRARRYLQLCDGGTLRPEFINACEQLQAAPGTTALCHNDLLQANRLRSGQRLLALDWEYAARGDPYFDLAAIIEGDGFGDSAAQQLLEAWLDGSADSAARQRLGHQRVVYRELSRLWELACHTLAARPGIGNCADAVGLL